MALQSALVLLAAAVAAAAGEDASDGSFIPLPIIHSTNPEYRLARRAVEISLPRRSDIAYYARLDFGTPAQPQYVQVDTGSFELWINPTCSGLASGDSSFCDAIGHYDPADSSSFTPSSAGSKVLRYGIGTANITYVLDDIALPGSSSSSGGGAAASTLRQVQFGVATDTDDEFSGILGLGFGLGLTTRYRNFVDELAHQNVTRVAAFSLALGSKAEQAGVLVFGGVDTAKFSGSLARLPIVPADDSPDGVPRYWVAMESMAMTTAATATTTVTKTYADSAMDVFFDSGSTLSLLPPDLVDAIAADLDAVGPDESGFYYVDCDRASASAGSLDFAFAGTTIRVPFNELIRQAAGQCMLGLQGSSDFALLGDTFLRSAYVVIDQTDNAVWMAPYVNCGSSPAAIVSAASLASLTGSCAAPSDNLTESSDSSSSSSSSPPSSSLSPFASSAPSAASSTPSSAASPTGKSSSSSSTSSTLPTSSSSSSSSHATQLSGSAWSASGIALAACVAVLTILAY